MSLKENLIGALRPLCGSYDAFRLCRGSKSVTALPHEEIAAPEIERRLPIVVEDKTLARFKTRLNVRLAPVYRATISDGWVTRDGTHVDAKNFLLSELSLHYADTLENHKAFHSLRPFRPCHRVKGALASLTGKGYYNYYHWVLEILPKLAQLEKLAPQDTPVYAPARFGFHRDALSFLGHKNVLPCEKYEVVKAETIFAASPPGPSGSPHPEDLAWLRKTFLPHAPARADAPRKIFINRQGANTRRIANHDVFKKFAEEKGFTEVRLETMSFAEQMALFRRAEFILAPHGAGLTNLAWCEHQPKVLELLSDLSVQPENPEACFWALSNILWMPHGVLECPATPNNLASRAFDLRVDIEKLDALYQKLIAL